MDLVRPFEGGFEQGERGLELTVERMSVSQQRLMPRKTKL